MEWKKQEDAFDLEKDEDKQENESFWEQTAGKRLRYPVKKINRRVSAGNQ